MRSFPRAVAVAFLAMVLTVGAMPVGGSTAPIQSSAASGATEPIAAEVDPADPVSGGVSAQTGGPPDPESDVLGWENGYWHNESIAVDQSDGLTDAELDAYVSRAMARVEYIRGREFDERVPVSVELRSEFRNRTQGTESNETFGAWNNQVWEALLIDGEDSDVQDELRQTSAESVVGFYSIRDGEIKVITETPDRPVIDNTTLVHELVHALQDQHYDLSDDRYRRETQDGDLAVDGVIEGEANLVEAIYVDRCGDKWNCVATPSQPRSGNTEPPNFGILLTIIQPYSDGPVYVDRVRERGGWAAVDRRLRNPPVSTEQVIHQTDEAPDPIAFTDQARNGWSIFPDQGENGSDTVGEASIYMMFWTQSRSHDAAVIDWRALLQTDHPYDLYDYVSEPSAGWGNDRVFPYHRTTDGEEEYGYVWMTRWDTERDARQFHEAHLAVLRAHGSDQIDPATYRVPDGPYADAFRVVRDGRTVTIVNGPAVDDLSDIRPELTPNQGSSTEDSSTTQSPSGPDVTEAPAQPGFGLPASLLAVLVAALLILARRRRR